MRLYMPLYYGDGRHHYTSTYTLNLNQDVQRLRLQKRKLREREIKAKNLFTTFIYEKGFLDLLFDAQDEGCVNHLDMSLRLQ